MSAVQFEPEEWKTPGWSDSSAFVVNWAAAEVETESVVVPLELTG